MRASRGGGGPWDWRRDAPGIAAAVVFGGVALWGDTEAALGLCLAFLAGFSWGAWG